MELEEVGDGKFSINVITWFGEDCNFVLDINLFCYINSLVISCRFQNNFNL